MANAAERLTYLIVEITIWTYKEKFMEEMTGVLACDTTPYEQFKSHVGETVTIKGRSEERRVGKECM